MQHNWCRRKESVCYWNDKFAVCPEIIYFMTLDNKWRTKPKPYSTQLTATGTPQSPSCSSLPASRRHQLQHQILPPIGLCTTSAAIASLCIATPAITNCVGGGGCVVGLQSRVQEQHRLWASWIGTICNLCRFVNWHCNFNFFMIFQPQYILEDTSVNCNPRNTPKGRGKKL